ncbi:hypothetical protein NSK_006636 [Nannochloropsis salina CCMP1776]|uniref:Kinase n=1 Tax=Nannochloropsis salina CCMP1776 TaxID=1027361 RepID=A0A4D9D021_9STRA|nr:hypothetical protein NSK_006636 [Nannochloropsis salina CCMP1776]|eukprot:TFJ81968.1 hypothetical protein NSK_006636 [Nannochloropsis salina CCMP1776]
MQSVDDPRFPACAGGNTYDVLPMPYQVGGHKPKDASDPPYMLRLQPRVAPHCSNPSSTSSNDATPPPRLLKVIQAGDKGTRETAFYHKLFGQDGMDGLKEDEINVWRSLRPFVPCYYGVLTRSDPTGNPRRYLVLEDISAPPNPGVNNGLSHCPTILDIKIGLRTYAPWATLQKQKRERDKYIHQEAVGFRIVGMRVYDADTKSYVVEGKEYGRNLRPEEVLFALARFLGRGRSLGVGGHARNDPCPGSLRSRQAKDGRQGGESERQKGKGEACPEGEGAVPEMERGEQEGAVRRLDWFIARVAALLDWFQGQACLCFWSSSLLFVDHQAWDRAWGRGPVSWEPRGQGARKEGAPPEEKGALDVRMIDFAHVQVREGGDEEGVEGGEDGWEAGRKNYAQGLRSLLEHLQRLRREATSIDP